MLRAKIVVEISRFDIQSESMMLKVKKLINETLDSLDDNATKYTELEIGQWPTRWSITEKKTNRIT